MTKISTVVASAAPLFRPLQLGALQLRSRVVMAPMTRCRADPLTRAPTAEFVDYYVQRASAGLLLTEATLVDPMGDGYAGTPGIWSEEQVEGWTRVTEAVHAAGGLIVVQLWHCGRISEADVFLGGQAPISASAVRAQGHVSLVRPKRPFSVPRALETSEIRPLVVDSFRRAAENAKRAGFDGVELHAGNGYLFDQFLQNSVNRRTDRYGGSVENRIRLLVESVDAVADVWGADRVGVHLSPRGDYNDMGDSNPRELFTSLASELGHRRIGFIMLRERPGPDSLMAEIKRSFGGPVIANEAFTVEEGVRALEAGDADALGLGYDYLANPDLVERLAVGAPLAAAPMDTFYTSGPGAKGFTDWPTLAEFLAREAPRTIQELEAAGLLHQQSRLAEGRKPKPKNENNDSQQQQSPMKKLEAEELEGTEKNKKTAAEATANGDLLVN